MRKSKHESELIPVSQGHISAMTIILRPEVTVETKQTKLINPQRLFFVRWKVVKSIQKGCDPMCCQQQRTMAAKVGPKGQFRSSTTLQQNIYGDEAQHQRQPNNTLLADIVGQAQTVYKLQYGSKIR